MCLLFLKSKDSIKQICFLYIIRNWIISYICHQKLNGLSYSFQNFIISNVNFNKYLVSKEPKALLSFVRNSI